MSKTACSDQLIVKSKQSNQSSNKKQTDCTKYPLLSFTISSIEIKANQANSTDVLQFHLNITTLAYLRQQLCQFWQQKRC